MYNDYLKKLALLLAIETEVEAMKAENMQRSILGYSLAYNENDFLEKAEELRKLSF